MWNEILLDDVLAREVSAVDALRKVASAQRKMNAVYDRTYTIAEVGRMMSRKKDLLLRVFLYDDGTTLATLITKRAQTGFRLLTTACGAGDPLVAAVIVQEKLKLVLAEHGETECFAIWGANNYEAGNIYFNGFVETAKTTFAEATNEEYREGRYRLTLKVDLQAEPVVV